MAGSFGQSAAFARAFSNSAGFMTNPYYNYAAYGSLPGIYASYQNMTNTSTLSTATGATTTGATPTATPADPTANINSLMGNVKEEQVAGGMVSRTVEEGLIKSEPENNGSSVVLSTTEGGRSGSATLQNYIAWFLFCFKFLIFFLYK